MVGKFRPIFSRDQHLAGHVEVVLDRILDRPRHFFPASHRVAAASRASSSCRCRSAPVARMMPCGRATISVTRGRSTGEKPSLSRPCNRRIAIEDAHDDLFAVDRRQGRDAQVDHAHRRLDRDPAVLRPPALGDVELGHDLEARHQRLVQLVQDIDLVDQHAIDAVAHDHALGARLDVDIGSTEPDRLEDDRVGNPDRRRRLGVAQQFLERSDVIVLNDDLDPLVGVGRGNQGSPAP